MKLRKWIVLLFGLLLAAAAAGCGGQEQSGARAANGQTGVADEVTNPGSDEGIDVDLTALSSTMVYTEVYNMMNVPEQYLGKTIKMEGQFAVYHEEATGTDYFACVIRDAAACCAQGVEFILSDAYVYPDDYPDEGDEITVTGMFDTYLEGDSRYCTLRDASLVS